MALEIIAATLAISAQEIGLSAGAFVIGALVCGAFLTSSHHDMILNERKLYQARIDNLNREVIELRRHLSLLPRP